MRRILNDTNHVLELYRHYVGESEVPLILHDWSCIAGIAACVADRVWIEKFRGEKLCPDLYTFLIGPSAVGKGKAIKKIGRIAHKVGVNTHAGPVTAEKLMEKMSGRPKEGQIHKQSKVFLVSEELAMCVGISQRAKSFIVHMTGMYGTDDGMPMKKGTITGANAEIYERCINWLAGTTMKWMTDSIPPEAIEGGFVGRLVAISVDYQDIRICRPRSPHDFVEVEKYLLGRFERLTRLTGEFRMSNDARDMEEHWYKERPMPTDERLIPTWKRQHDVLLKLAMVCSLMESSNLYIQRRHVREAQDFLTQSEPTARMILEASSLTERTMPLDLVRRTIKQAKQIQHSVLMRKLTSRGIDKRQLDDAIATLKVTREISQDLVRPKRGMPAKVYHWEKRS